MKCIFVNDCGHNSEKFHCHYLLFKHTHPKRRNYTKETLSFSCSSSSCRKSHLKKSWQQKSTQHDYKLSSLSISCDMITCNLFSSSSSFFIRNQSDKFQAVSHLMRCMCDYQSRLSIAALREMWDYEPPREEKRIKFGFKVKYLKDTFVGLRWKRFLIFVIYILILVKST